MIPVAIAAATHVAAVTESKSMISGVMPNMRGEHHGLDHDDVSHGENVVSPASDSVRRWSRAP